MASVRHDTADRLRQRICLACGYRGPEVQQGFPIEVFVCPACACDLYARPPRSYAEMEGVGAANESDASPGPRTAPARASRDASPVVVAARWLRRAVRRVLFLDQ
jgi:hypothetical protein